MMLLVAQPLDPLRQQIAFATLLGAVFLDMLPVPSPSPMSSAPVLTLGVVFFWLVRRAESLRAWQIFLASLVFDAMAGLPIGVTGFCLLAAQAVILMNGRVLQSRSFPVVWACFLLAASLVLGLRWLVVSLWWGRAFALEPVLVEIALTAAAYPLLAWLLARLVPYLPRHGYASGG